ncbi:MAG TPA: metallophosphoesterase [Polyangiaceae bacterium]|jgi:UDP-2,3-diacylglucosamine pyrophosphatase LpxH|nr:metallophosphoesterase [Polyangiaceae bacterium]
MRTLIISDLHLGNGGPYDSFAGEEALPAFLDRYASEPTRIIVNGDGVDFLMNEEPLELDADRAVAQARAIAAYPGSAAVLESMGRALAAGCEVIFRLGNHDVELALPEVQEVLRAALRQPPEVAAKLGFELGDQPAVIEVGGARVLVTHGEHNDPWNRVDDYKGLLAKSGSFRFAPGSELVKRLLNRLTFEHGLKFANLLKPDFQGAALTALAVAPSAMRLLLGGSTASILWQLFRKMSGPASFDEEPDLGLADRVAEAGLTEEETEALEAALGDGAVPFVDEEDGPLDRARVKLARTGLKLYAKFQRTVTGREGETFFALEPTPDEWKEARRLAEKFDVGAVIIGHTHAARWGEQDGLVFVNTGTWISLMELPPFDAGNEVWSDFLEELGRNPRLDPAKQKVARTTARFTAALVEDNPGGGAKVSLVQWLPGEGLKDLGSATIPKRAEAIQ